MSNMTNVSCAWKLFNDDEKKTLDDAIDLTGILSCALSLWFILAYFFTSLKENWSYYNIGVFFISAWVRRFTPVLLNYVFIDKQGELPEEIPHCKIFAFVETFLGVHEVECLTHICIERYVVAKYICNGWAMPRKHYVMFRRLCILFASAYSLAPALGLGRFGPDFGCARCTMDVILPEGRLMPYVVLIFVLRSIKPAGFMIFMLIGCKSYESTYSDSENHQLQRQITRDAIAVTCVCLACWAPIAALRGGLVLAQLVSGAGALWPPAAYVKWALLLHWNSLVPAVVALFMLDANVRGATSQLRLRDVFGQKHKRKDE